MADHNPVSSDQVAAWRVRLATVRIGDLGYGSMIPETRYARLGDLEVELIWFSDCPNHPIARRLLEEVIAEVAPGTSIRDIDASDPDVAAAMKFPGSPTIRVNGRDVDPFFIDPGEYTPRCRLYWTPDGPRGVPPRDWIEAALRG